MCGVLCGLQSFHTQFILFSYISVVKLIGNVLQPLLKDRSRLREVN